MPIKKSAKKALRQTKKRTAHNKVVKGNVKYLWKKSTKAIESQEKEAEDLVKKYTKAIDKSVQKKILKKNTGARRKSKMIKKLNAAFKK